MTNQPESERENEHPAFSREVGAKAARKLKAQRHSTPGVWSGLGMMGLIGWSVVVPTLLGAALGTTSLDFTINDIHPTQEPLVYNDTNDAKSALNNGQIDGIVVDLPTAYYITAVEIDDSTIVGQFPAQESGEQFGMLFAKGNPLVSCVNGVLAELSASGELQAIQDEWLAGEAAPYFTE